MRLDHILAAADLETMQQHMSQKNADGAPFLLQPLVAAPHLIDGEPNLRLLLLAKLLTKGALLNGSAKAAAVAAITIQQIMLVSVCRGFTSMEGLCMCACACALLQTVQSLSVNAQASKLLERCPRISVYPSITAPSSGHHVHEAHDTSASAHDWHFQTGPDELCPADKQVFCVR